MFSSYIIPPYEGELGGDMLLIPNFYQALMSEASDGHSPSYRTFEQVVIYLKPNPSKSPFKKGRLSLPFISSFSKEGG